MTIYPSGCHSGASVKPPQQLRESIMKKFIVLAVVAVAAYFVFFNDTFDTDFPFDGQIYSHVSKVRGGEVTNHFYTPDGESFNTATSSIQIIELSEDMQDRTFRHDQLSGLFSQYNLTPVGNQPLEVAGHTERSGFFFSAYSAPIGVKGTEHQAFYLVTTSEKPTGRAVTETEEIIDQLKGLGAYLE